MKQVWVCQWEVVPGVAWQEKEYSSFPQAVKAMRQLITEHMDLSPHYKEMQPAAANYIGKYLSDPDFPYSMADVPDDDDYELPDAGDLALYDSYICWQECSGACPELRTTIVQNPDQEENLFFDFWYEYPEKAPSVGAKAISIRIIPCVNFGTSAYPVMIWRVLRETPMHQQQIAQRVMAVFGAAVERKAIGRHLRMLQDLGFPVRQNAEGYYISGEMCPPKPEKYGTSAYPLMVLQVLSTSPKTHQAIIDAVMEKYNTRIDRKAIGRHLELLAALRIPVGKNSEGSYLTR